MQIFIYLLPHSHWPHTAITIFQFHNYLCQQLAKPLLACQANLGQLSLCCTKWGLAKVAPYQDISSSYNNSMILILS